MSYTIQQVSKMTHIPATTLRYYDKEGLLPFVERSSGGIRMFQEKDYEWLKVISCLKKAGMSLKDIREYINLAMQGDDTIDDTELYGAFVLVAGSVQKHGLTSESEMNRLIADGLKDYKEPSPGAKERIEQVLRIMITAWRAAQLQTKAQSMMNALCVSTDFEKGEIYFGRTDPGANYAEAGPVVRYHSFLSESGIEKQGF